jgi:hypothetical protein
MISDVFDVGFGVEGEKFQSLTWIMKDLHIFGGKSLSSRECCLSFFFFIYTFWVLLIMMVPIIGFISIFLFVLSIF